jgi:hypothetical protein
MTLFSSTLSEVETQLFQNLKKTKAVFPEETRRIEWGLELMRDLTIITKNALTDYPDKPNFLANHNLFARNRQLFLNAYLSLLFSSYGTQFVILRTTLENSNLMRLFNKNPQLAFEWLPKSVQKQLSKKAQMKYTKTGKHDVTYHPTSVRDLLYEELGKANVKRDLKKFYDQLCNYTHPNYRGWRELVVQTGKTEGILNMPYFLAANSETGVGANIFLMQLSFKGFVDTFKDYLLGFAKQLEEWQSNYRKLLMRYVEQDTTTI